MSVPSWRDHAACSDADPALFDHDDPYTSEAVDTVRAYCHHCPVTDDCFKWAEGEPFFEGIAAGHVWRGPKHNRTRPGPFTRAEARRAHFLYTKGYDRTPGVIAGERAYQRYRKQQQRKRGAA